MCSFISALRPGYHPRYQPSTAAPQCALFDSKHVFYWAIAPLVGFYALYAGFLLPNAHWLEPTALLTRWASLPESLSCFVKVAVHWTAALFFLMVGACGGSGVAAHAPVAGGCPGDAGPRACGA